MDDDNSLSFESHRKSQKPYANNQGVSLDVHPSLDTGGHKNWGSNGPIQQKVHIFIVTLQPAFTRENHLQNYFLHTKFLALLCKKCNK